MAEQALDFYSIGKQTVPSVFPSNLHICHFYENKEDLLELLLPYFMEGLYLNQFCLWGVANPLTVDSAKAELRNFVGEKKFTEAVERDQIEIFDVSKLYGSGLFDAMAVKDAFLNKVFSVRQNGWKNFRCDGMASAISPSNWRNYQTYEMEITRSIQTQVTALCSYDLSKMTEAQKKQVEDTHLAAVRKTPGGWIVVR